jgi:F-type H+-transporting ATPase subunit c
MQTRRRIHPEAAERQRQPKSCLQIIAFSQAVKISYCRSYDLAAAESAKQNKSNFDRRKTMTRNVIRLVVSLMVVLFSAVSAFAQTPEGSGSGLGRGLGYIGAVVGFGIAAGLCGLGQGRVGAAACEGLARNPGAFKGVPLPMILGLVFIETLVIFTLVVVLLIVPQAGA